MIRWTLALALLAPIAAQAADDDYGWPEKTFGDWSVYRNMTGCWIVRQDPDDGSSLSLSARADRADLFIDLINEEWEWKSTGEPTMTVRFGTVSLSAKVEDLSQGDTEYAVLFDAPADSYASALKVAAKFHLDIGAGRSIDVPLDRPALTYFEQCTVDLRKAK